MTWQYSQSTGRLTWNGRQVGTGYSGAGDNGKNNPRMESVEDVGPIPRGRYRIGASQKHPTKGPITMSLSPDGHAAHGRTHFLIHGDSIAHPGAASQGCVILSRDIRSRISESGDTTLEVVE